MHSLSRHNFISEIKTSHAETQQDQNAVDPEKTLADVGRSVDFVTRIEQPKDAYKPRFPAHPEDTFICG